MNKICLFFTLLSFASCQKKQTKEIEVKVNPDPVITEVKVTETPARSFADSEFARKWLIESIEENFKTTEGLIDSICTKDYATYKSDAIGVEYDGGMTQKAFEKKWKSKFNAKLAGIGTGFLISGQDWNKIKVKSCKVSDKKMHDGYLFETVIEDVGATSKTIYKRDIQVIHSGKFFLIADVLEYE
jgi:hypothetical protein